jgi:hypothetical protein
LYGNFGKRNSTRMKKIFGKKKFEWFTTLTKLNIFFIYCLQNIYY